MKLKKIFLFTLIIIIIPSFFVFAGNYYAGIENPTGLDDGQGITGMIKLMISGVLQLAIPFLVLAIIYVGFLFAKAQGNPGELDKARKALIWVLVGAAIVLGANSIYSVIEDTIHEANSGRVSINYYGK